MLIDAFHGEISRIVIVIRLFNVIIRIIIIVWIVWLLYLIRPYKLISNFLEAL